MEQANTDSTIETSGFVDSVRNEGEGEGESSKHTVTSFDLA